MGIYKYRGTKVMIPGGAEVSGIFLPHGRGGALSGLVQEALNAVEPWERGEDPIETVRLPKYIGSRAVALTVTETPLWGVNPHHKTRERGLSPYVALPETRDPRQRTNVATIELAGTVDRPILTKVYPGEYIPPLPWMKTAGQSPGGKEETIAYWQGHAFVLRDTSAPAELTGQPPEWYAPRPTPQV